jgi:hypothetical protein
MVRKIVLSLIVSLVVLGIILFPNGQAAHAANSVVTAGTGHVQSRSVAVLPHCLLGHDDTCYYPCSQVANDNDCTGSDPYSSGCGSDAQVLKSVALGSVGYYDLMWSPRCKSNWVYVATYSGTADMDGFVALNGTAGETSVPYEGYTAYGVYYLWTDMLFAPSTHVESSGVIRTSQGSFGACYNQDQTQPNTACGWGSPW